MSWKRRTSQIVTKQKGYRVAGFSFRCFFFCLLDHQFVHLILKGGQAHEHRNDDSVYRSMRLRRYYDLRILWRMVSKPETETRPKKQRQVRKV